MKTIARIELIAPTRKKGGYIYRQGGYIYRQGKAEGAPPPLQYAQVGQAVYGGADVSANLAKPADPIVRKTWNTMD